MLEGATVACPEVVRPSGTPPRSFWRLSYHTLFSAHLYLQVRHDDFGLWELHRDDVLGDGTERLDEAPYAKAEILAYWDLVDATVDPQIDRIDLTAPDSAIPWSGIPKLDHVLLNLRHIQQHAGQLRDRLLETGIDQKWHTRR
jgi:hypothetical protein